MGHFPLMTSWGISVSVRSVSTARRGQLPVIAVRRGQSIIRAVGRQAQGIGRKHPHDAGIGSFRSQFETKGMRTARRVHHVGQIGHRSIFVGPQNHLHLRTVGFGEFFAFGGDQPLQIPDRHRTAVEENLSAGGNMYRNGRPVRIPGCRKRSFDGKTAKHHHCCHHGNGGTEPQHGETAFSELGHHGKSFFGE